MSAELTRLDNQITTLERSLGEQTSGLLARGLECAAQPATCPVHVCGVDLPSQPPTAPPPASEAPNADGGGPRPPVTLVVCVGGCTFAEIAALRWLGRNGTPRREYLIATTHICNGDTLIEGLITACENGLEKLDS